VNYEEVGIFEHKVKSTSAPHSSAANWTPTVRRKKVFNASPRPPPGRRDAGVPGVKARNGELFMKTTRGGSLRPLQMDPAKDALALDKQADPKKTLRAQNIY